jgi:hypothetical protein
MIDFVMINHLTFGHCKSYFQQQFVSQQVRVDRSDMFNQMSRINRYRHYLKPIILSLFKALFICMPDMPKPKNSTTKFMLYMLEMDVFHFSMGYNNAQGTAGSYLEVI